MNVISVQEFNDLLAREKGSTDVDFINVCTPAEYAEQHIEGVRNLPLDSVTEQAASLQGKRRVYVHCRSGKRAEKAIQQLQSRLEGVEFINVAGGLLAWNEANLPTRSLTSRLPIMRQVLLTAGLLVLLGVSLGVLVAPAWLGLAAFVGAGLTFAGATGWCGMSKVLAVMPWNK